MRTQLHARSSCGQAATRDDVVAVVHELEAIQASHLTSLSADFALFGSPPAQTHCTGAGDDQRAARIAALKT